MVDGEGTSGSIVRGNARKSSSVGTGPSGPAASLTVLQPSGLRAQVRLQGSPQ